MNDDLNEPLAEEDDLEDLDPTPAPAPTTTDSLPPAKEFDSAFGANETSQKLILQSDKPIWQIVLLYYKGFIIGFILFFIFLFVRVNPESPQSPAQSKTIGVSLFMISLWLTEQVPISITSLLPIVLFPLCGILDTAQVTAQYANNVTFLLTSSFMIALAMERWDLHKRLVYFLLLRFGASPKKILAGIMISTCFLSMWMSNATVALIMLPIAHSISLNAQGAATSGISPKRLERAYMLAIAFAANIGGSLTPIGSPPNLVTISILRQTFPDSPEISFLLWMSYAVPLGVLAICVAFVYLSWRFFGLFGNDRPEHFVSLAPAGNGDEYTLFPSSDSGLPPSKAASTTVVALDSRTIFQEKLNALGPIKSAEKVVSVAFMLLILLWIFRADFIVDESNDCSSWSGCMPGWHHIFTDGLNDKTNPELYTGDRDQSSSLKSRYVEDSVTGFLIVLPLFLIPAGDGEGSMILDWETVVKLPWNVLWLVGGGFALAAAFEQTGLAKWFADSLQGLATAPPFAVLVVVIILVVFLTTISSNFVVSSAIVPVLGTFAAANQINPFFLCIPSTVAVSYAFLLPTSSTSNAVIFSTGKMPMKTMLKHGILMTASGILLILACWASFGQFAYRAQVFESWAFNTSETA